MSDLPKPPFHVRPKANYKSVTDTKPRIYKDRTYRVASYATNQPDWQKEGKIFINGLLLTRADYDVLP